MRLPLDGIEDTIGGQPSKKQEVHIELGNTWLVVSLLAMEVLKRYYKHKFILLYLICPKARDLRNLIY